MKMNASNARQKANEGYVSSYENRYANVDKKLNKADDLLKYIPLVGLNTVSKFREQTNQLSFEEKLNTKNVIPPPILPKNIKLNSLYSEKDSDEHDHLPNDGLINDENQKVF